MITRKFQLLFAAACAVLLGACHDDGLKNHSCPLSYSTDWDGHGLTVEHTEPKECPVFITTAGLLELTGAAVYDGVPEEFLEAWLDVKDTSGDPVGTKRQPFGRASDGRWVAPTYAEYRAGQDNFGPDKAMFTLLYKNATTGPKGTMTITYRSDVLVSISGPGAVASGATQTYTAFYPER